MRLACGASAATIGPRRGSTTSISACGKRLAQRGDAFDEAAVRAVQLIALMNAGDPHPNPTPRRCRRSRRAIPCQAPRLLLSARKPNEPAYADRIRTEGVPKWRSRRNTLLILGTRGVPANHGGFETFAERYALFLAERGWNVSVYCQEDVEKVDAPRADRRRGAASRRIFVPTARKGGLGDARLRLEMRARRADAPGRLSGARLQRRGVPAPAAAVRPQGVHQHGRHRVEAAEMAAAGSRLVLLNEWIAAWTSQRLVADHPAIADHLATRRLAPRDRSSFPTAATRRSRRPRRRSRARPDAGPLSDLHRAHRARQQHRDDGARVLARSGAA